MADKKPMPRTIPMDIKTSKLLIAYNEVIKQPGLYILRKIRDEYMEKFKPYINTELLAEISDKDLPYIYAARNVINPLQWLAITEFDYEANYNSLAKRFKTMYIESEPTTLNQHMTHFLKAFFITDLCFWTEEYDKRVDFDIQSTYNNTDFSEKVKYVTGPLDGCIRDIHPDVVFYPYITDDMWKLSRDNKDIVFIYPTYLFNVTTKGILHGQPDDEDNVGTYPIIQSSTAHFMG